MKILFQLTMLFAVVCLLSCNKNDDNIQAPVILLEVQVGDNYFNNSTSSGHIFLSKPDGSLIESKQFSNSTSLEFENTEDLTDPFLVTIVRGSSSFSTFYEVPPGSSWFLDYPVFNNEMPTGNSVLTIENTGNLAPYPFFVSSGNRDGYGINQSNNNMAITFKTDEITSALAIYKSNDDNQVRFAYQEAISPGGTITLEHTSLPTIATPTVVELPSSPIGYFSIKGNPIGSDELLLDVSEVFNGSGTTSHYVPEGIFEKLLTHADGSLSSNEFYVVESSGTSLPQSVELPSLDFNAIATSNGFNATSSPGFDVVNTCLTNAAQSFTWCITSERKSDFAFALPAVPTGIINGNLDMAGLKVSSISATNYEPFNSFGEYLSQLNSNNGVSFDFSEYILKYFN